MIKLSQRDDDVPPTSKIVEEEKTYFLFFGHDTSVLMLTLVVGVAVYFLSRFFDWPKWTLPSWCGGRKKFHKKHIMGPSSKPLLLNILKLELEYKKGYERLMSTLRDENRNKEKNNVDACSSAWSYNETWMNDKMERAPPNLHPVASAKSVEKFAESLKKTFTNKSVASESSDFSSSDKSSHTDLNNGPSLV